MNPVWRVFSTIKKLTSNFVRFNKLPASKLQGVATRAEISGSAPCLEWKSPFPLRRWGGFASGLLDELGLKLHGTDTVYLAVDVVIPLH